MLLNEGNLSHRLFNNAPKQLSFIKTEGNGIIRVDGNFHNFIIKISDANSNITEIQGVISGQMIQNQDINFYKDLHGKYIIETNNPTDNIYFNLQSKYHDVEKSISKRFQATIDLSNILTDTGNFNSFLILLMYVSLYSNGTLHSKKISG